MAFARWELWLGALANLALGAMWFRHAHALSGLTRLSFGLTDKLFAPEMLVGEYPIKVGIRLLKDVLGPVGVAFGIYGFFVARRARKYAEPLGVSAFLVYLIVVTIGNLEHNYYQLPIVPIATTLAAIGITAAVNQLALACRLSDEARLNAYAIILGIALLSTFVRSVSAHNWYEVNHAGVTVCKELSAVLAPRERVVFTNYENPDILFCIDRKGWLLPEAATTENRLRELVDDGAAVFVTEKRHESTRRILQEIAEPLAETREFAAYRIRRPAP